MLRILAQPTMVAAIGGRGHGIKRRILALVTIATLLVLVLAACGGGPSPATSAPTAQGSSGKTVMAISDAAGDMGVVTNISMTIDGIRVHSSGGAWATVSTTAHTYDLLELRAKGVTQLLAEVNLPTGTYNQVELSVSKVIVVDNKGQHEAKLPSDKLQIKGDLEVNASTTATANFDFLADRSLHVTGEGQYILAPVVKLETRTAATAEVQANNEVRIQGGQVRTSHEVGMDIEGSMEIGLSIPADAVLSIAASGKVVQPKGQAMAIGTIKAVDSANGTVTIATRNGNEIVLHVASDSGINISGQKVNLTSLAAKVGAEVTAKFNAESKQTTQIVAGGDDKAKAAAGAELKIEGTIKAVNPASGTVLVASNSGVDVVLKVGADSKLQIDNAALTISGLMGRVGSRVEATYDANTRTVVTLQAQGEATATVTGTIKAVDAAAGTITVTTQAGADVTINVASRSRVLVNASVATLATLKSMVGSAVTVTYSQQDKIVTELNAEAKVEQSVNVSGVLKAVNPATGTVTITTGNGQEVVLNVTAASSIVADGSISSMVQLAANIGANVTALYNAQTRTALSLKAEARSQGIGQASGTLKSVNVLENTVTITTKTGSDMTLSVSQSTKLFLNSALSSLATLALNLGAPINAEYNTQANTALVLSIQTSAATPQPTPAPPSATGTVKVTGTLKAVNMLANTVTIGVQGSADLVLNVKSQSLVTIGGASSSLAALATKIGSQVTVEYNVQTSAVLSLSI